MIRLLIITGLVALLIGSHYAAIEYGKEIQAGTEAQARQDIINDQQEKIKVVYQEKVKIEVKYRDRVKTIYQAADPTGCLDATLADVGLLPTSASN